MQQPRLQALRPPCSTLPCHVPAPHNHPAPHLRGGIRAQQRRGRQGGVRLQRRQRSGPPLGSGGQRPWRPGSTATPRSPSPLCCPTWLRLSSAEQREEPTRNMAPLRCYGLSGPPAAAALRHNCRSHCWVAAGGLVSHPHSWQNAAPQGGPAARSHIHRAVLHPLSSWERHQGRRSVRPVLAPPHLAERSPGRRSPTPTMSVDAAAVRAAAEARRDHIMSNLECGQLGAAAPALQPAAVLLVDPALLSSACRCPMRCRRSPPAAANATASPPAARCRSRPAGRRWRRTWGWSGARSRSTRTCWHA